MRDFLIYNEADFKDGQLIGAELVDDNLENKFKELNNAVFNEPIFTNWQDSILNEKYIEDITYSNESSFINVAIRNNDIQDKIKTENFCTLMTNFFNEDNVPVETDTLSLNISWRAAEIQHEGKVIIKVTGHDPNIDQDSYQEIHINNKAEMLIKSYHTDSGDSIEYITDTDAEKSLRPITNYISNYIDEGWLDFRIKDEKIYTRFRAKGNYSVWYEFDFDGEISELEVIQPANDVNLNRVYKKLTINEILIDGYNDSTIYESDVLDIQDEDSPLNNIEAAGIAQTEKLYNATAGSNIIDLEIHYGNTIEEMNNQYITVSKELDTGVFSFDEDLENIEGRYAKIKIVNISKYFQNTIDHIILDYTPQSLLDKIDKQVDEYIIENVDMSIPNVIETETDNFPFRIVIPDEANGPDSVDIIRHQEGELFAEGMFGFEFDPIPELDRYILIEVDYSGYNFNPYMSEEGLLIGYLDLNDDPRQLETITFSTRNKVLAYYL